MSDPFADIDKEVNLEKLKNFFYKYKVIILALMIFLITITSILFYLSHNKTKKNLEISGYYVKIISLLQSDEEQAIIELEKLKKFKHQGYNFLSNIIIAKSKLKNGNITEAYNIIQDLEKNKIKDQLFNKLIIFYKAQILLDLNKKDELQNSIGQLLSFGSNWALLGHEIRGHYHFKNGDYELAIKDFKKIAEEQSASSAIKSRAKDMIDSIIIYN